MRKPAKGWSHEHWEALTTEQRIAETWYQLPFGLSTYYDDERTTLTYAQMTGLVAQQVEQQTSLQEEG